MNFESLKTMSVTELRQRLEQSNKNHDDNFNDYMELSKAFAYVNYNNHLQECDKVLFSPTQLLKNIEAETDSIDINFDQSYINI